MPLPSIDFTIQFLLLLISGSLWRSFMELTQLNLEMGNRMITHLALHIPDGFLSLPIIGSTSVIAIALVLIALKQVQSTYEERTVPLMGVCGAFIFAAQMIETPCCLANVSIDFLTPGQ